MEKLTSNYAANAAELDLLLGVGRSCDMVSRDYVIGGRRARLWVVDGFGSDSIIERMGAFWLTLKPEHVAGLTQMQEFLDRFITFSESNVTFDVSDAVTSVFLGKSLLIMEGLSGAALMDAKGYPSRGVDSRRMERCSGAVTMALWRRWFPIWRCCADASGTRT